MSYDGHTLSLASLHYLLIFRLWYCIICIKQPEIIFCLKQLIIIFDRIRLTEKKKPSLKWSICFVSGSLAETPFLATDRKLFQRQGPLTLPHLALQSWTLSTEFTQSSTAAFECDAIFMKCLLFCTLLLCNKWVIDFQKILNISRTFSFLFVICFEQPRRSQKPVTLSSPACLFFLY